MDVWRLFPRHFRSTAFTGAGGLHAAGRWNHLGLPHRLHLHLARPRRPRVLRQPRAQRSPRRPPHRRSCRPRRRHRNPRPQPPALHLAQPQQQNLPRPRLCLGRQRPLPRPARPFRRRRWRLQRPHQPAPPRLPPRPPLPAETLPLRSPHVPLKVGISLTIPSSSASGSTITLWPSCTTRPPERIHP